MGFNSQNSWVEPGWARLGVEVIHLKIMDFEKHWSSWWSQQNECYKYRQKDNCGVKFENVTYRHWYRSNDHHSWSFRNVLYLKNSARKNVHLFLRLYSIHMKLKHKFVFLNKKEICSPLALYYKLNDYDICVICMELWHKHPTTIVVMSS